MYHATNTYLRQNGDLGITKAYLWSNNDGKTSWTVDGRQGTKLAKGKIVNCSYSSYSCQKCFFHDNSVIVVDAALQITPTSCTYSLAAPVWLKKNDGITSINYIFMTSN